MKQVKKGFVEVPIPTLNALKNMLLDNEGDIGLSLIISDLTFEPEQRDLTAINVALTYKGVQPDIDERPHYEYEWRNRYYRYDYAGYSLILGCIKVRPTLLEVDENGEEKIVSTYDHLKSFDMERWNNLDIELSSIYAKIAERTK